MAAVSTRSADAAVILPGLYQLHNHPDGAIRPPLYGLRLDELFDATTNIDRYTCDFDDAQSDMKLFYDDGADTIHIYGQSLCGRDTGSSYANDVYKAVYDIDFTYSVGVQPVPGDDDIWVAAPMNSNFGTITHPTLGTKNLADKNSGDHTFRFGDENNDLGHRGFPGISGWGWLSIDGQRFSGASDDWLFTAEYIPEPGTAALLALAGALAAYRRR